MTTLAEEKLVQQPCRGPSPDLEVEHRDSASQIIALIDALPGSQQEAIRLRFQSGLSYREISQVTGHSVSHVGVLLHTGLAALRARLAGTGS
jgi:RNA polymerase sigma-70 factor (ECF subfamily)